jgi:hypothetical protein
VYVAEPTSVVNADELCSRPSTENVCCAVPHAVRVELDHDGLLVALAPSATVSVAG